jgi:hypothetical protein
LKDEAERFEIRYVVVKVMSTTTKIVYRMAATTKCLITLECLRVVVLMKVYGNMRSIFKMCLITDKEFYIPSEAALVCLMLEWEGALLE